MDQENTKPAVEGEAPAAEEAKIPGAGETALAPEPAAASRSALSSALAENAPPGTSSELKQEGEPIRTVFQDPVNFNAVSYTHLRAHQTSQDPVCRLLLEKKKL